MVFTGDDLMALYCLSKTFAHIIISEFRTPIYIYTIWPKGMRTSDHLVLPQTVGPKFEAQNCVECLCAVTFRIFLHWY